MANLKKVVYLSISDYQDLVTNGSTTISGETITYDENNLYITPEDSYTSKPAASGGTDVSLVTTGEKYTWNSKESTSNKVTSISSTSTDTQYPSAKAVYTFHTNNKDVFIVTYGTTDYGDIVTAYNAGKICICVYNDNCYQAISAGSGGVVFTCPLSSGNTGLILLDATGSTDEWSNSTVALEKTSNKVTSIESYATSNEKYPTTKAVKDAIDAAITELPDPMVFKGTIGTNGTITWANLPAPSATPGTSNKGHTYKVITAYTNTGASDYRPTSKVGDTIISTGTEWSLIPSGDEPSGTVTSVGMTVPTGLSVSGSPITSSGTLAVTYSNGYSIPTTTKQGEWDAKYAKPLGGIPDTDLTAELQSKINSKRNTYIVSSVTNPIFNNTSSSVLVNSDIVDIDGNTVSLSDIRTGDVFYVKETDTVDRWVSSSAISLPTEYTKLTYIEGSGSSYIDTDIAITSTDCSLMLDMEWTGTTLSAFESFAGFMDGATTLPRFGIHKYSGTYMYGTNTTRSTSVAPDSTRTTIEVVNKNSTQDLYKDGLLIDSVSLTPGALQGNTLSLYLFARNSTSMNISRMRLYSAILSANDRLYKFVPCKNNNNVPGLYELSEGVFYPSETSTAFTVGPVDTSVTIELSAIESAVSISPSSDTPASVGTSGSAGSSPRYSRADHVHAISSATIVGALGYTPPSTDTTYTLETETDTSKGVVKITPSSGNSTSVSISGSGGLSVSSSKSGSTSTVTVGVDSTHTVPTTTSWGKVVFTDTNPQTITGGKIFTAQTKLQNGNPGGCLIVGADVSATTLSNNTRKLGRLTAPSAEDITKVVGFVSVDNNVGYNNVEFGSRHGDATSYGPDVIAFSVATTHNTTTRNNVAQFLASKVQLFNHSSNSSSINIAPNTNLVGMWEFNNDNTFVNNTKTYTLPNKTGTIALTGDLPDKLSDIINDRAVVYDVNTQGLTDAQKGNARTNIDAASSSHVHTTSIATDTGSADIDLALGGKYKLTAGETSIVFTMPTSGVASNQKVKAKASDGTTDVTFGADSTVAILGDGAVSVVGDSANNKITISAETGLTYSLVSHNSTGTGYIPYIDASSLTYTSASSSGTAKFVKTINGGSGSFTPTTKYLGVSYTSGTAYTSSNTKYMHWLSGSVPTREEKTFVTGYSTTPDVNFNTGNTADNKYVYDISNTPATGTPTTAYLRVLGTSFVTDIDGGSGQLYGTRSTSGSGQSARRTLTFSHTHTAASVSAQDTAVTSVTKQTTSQSGDITYLEAYSVSGGSTTATPRYMKYTAPVHSTDKTWSITGVGSTSSLAFNTDSSGGEAFISTVSSGSVGGSVSLTENDSTATGRITYIKSATHSHTAASVATDGDAVTGITAGSLTKTDKYLELKGE